MKQQRGITLLELIITLAVVGILIGLATPSFRAMIQNNRITTQVNEFVTAVNMARSEAVRRGDPVTLCSSEDGQSCTGQDDWAIGWIVLGQDTDGNDEVLRVWRAPSGQPVMAEQDNESEVIFLPNGMVDRELRIRHSIPDATCDQVRIIRLIRGGRTDIRRLECDEDG
ncbi:GspH/FimT family pseudopilin [Natronospira bacteriovora]|uniref:Type II secretion system protein H n=1 Tax=Natronospira bacteriovora TaxID=3069753 RepID=A0ABU0W4C1_9GAMM|nr:GspH/FimT family pseudopilin [Natronospira sp. AB-CW4]MDQ2068804.1 GspH/FimT family pseudopilin [Natronospira sp. AB-CW4]